MMRIIGGLLLLALLGVGLVAAQDGTGQTITAQAQVSGVTLNSDAAPPTVTVTGSLPDACTELGDALQTLDGTIIVITLLTERPADQLCAQVLERFETEITINTDNLPAGDYAVSVNGVTADTTLTVSAAAQAGPEATEAPQPAACPQAEAGVTLAYLDVAGGYCMLYPVGYDLTTPQANVVRIAPPSTAAAITPNLTITAVPAEGLTLREVSDNVRADFPGTEITFRLQSIGGQAALVSSELPGRTAGRQAFVIWENRLYSVVVQPIDDQFPQATQLAESLWQTVTGSLVFIEAEAVAANALNDRAFDDLGIALLIPDDWTVERATGFYGLNPPGFTPQADGEQYLVTLSSVDDFPPFANLDELAAVAIERYETQPGVTNLFNGLFVSEAGGVIGVTLFGWPDLCQLTLIPANDAVTTISVTSDACDASGRLATPEVEALLSSVRLLDQ